MRRPACIATDLTGSVLTMRRRELLLAAARGGRLPARRAGAQPAPRSVRIGWLTAQRPASLVPFVQAFRTSLAELGFVEGRNLTIDFRYADDDASKVAGARRRAGAPAGRPDRRAGRGGARDQVDGPAGAGGLCLQRRSGRRRARREPGPPAREHDRPHLHGGRAERQAARAAARDGAVRSAASRCSPIRTIRARAGERANSDATAGRIGFDAALSSARAPATS